MYVCACWSTWKERVTVDGWGKCCLAGRHYPIPPLEPRFLLHRRRRKVELQVEVSLHSSTSRLLEPGPLLPPPFPVCSRVRSGAVAVRSPAAPTLPRVTKGDYQHVRMMKSGS